RPVGAFRNGSKLRDRTARPAMVDKWPTHPGGLLGDDFLSLLFRTSKQDGTAMGDRVFHKLLCAIDERQGLLQVNNVDAVTLGEDKAFHLRVPTTCLVPEVSTRIQ